jgi:uncharacterized damage-inducible protein DinB
MKFETLYLELVNSTDMILTFLAGLSQEEAQVKPNEGSWSILQTLCHLYDEEREDFREHLDFILNRQDQKWHIIDPSAWVTDRKYNDQDFREMKERFFAERSKSLDWLKGLANANWDVSYASEFGTMTAGEMFAAWVAHDNLALRQLVELRRSRIESITRPYSVAYAGDW